LRLSERRATNIGLLYPKVRNNIGGDIPVDAPPQPKYWGNVSPASPAGLTPVNAVLASIPVWNQQGLGVAFQDAIRDNELERSRKFSRTATFPFFSAAKIIINPIPIPD